MPLIGYILYMNHVAKDRLRRQGINCTWDQLYDPPGISINNHSRDWGQSHCLIDGVHARNDKILMLLPSLDVHWDPPWHNGPVLHHINQSLFDVNHSSISASVSFFPDLDSVMMLVETVSEFRRNGIVLFIPTNETVELRRLLFGELKLQATWLTSIYTYVEGIMHVYSWAI